MKSVTEDIINENYDSAFKTFLTENENNLNNNSNNSNTVARFKKYELNLNSVYEFKKIKVPIKYNKNELIQKFTVYHLFETIDLTSKEIIIKELKPKRITLFLGENIQLNPLIKNLNDEANLKCQVLKFGKKETIKFNDNLFPVKYDSTILQKLPVINVKDYGIIYNLKNTFLKLKQKRDGSIQEASLVYYNKINCSDDNEEELITNNNTNLKIITENLIKNHNDICDSLQLKEETEFNDKSNNLFFTCENLKLANIKRELSNTFINDKFIILKNKITNLNCDFYLYLNNLNELILEGTLNQNYLKVKNFVMNNLINITE